ncbi:AMP nucleosidase [Corynebacterium ammoniagenes]|jgi:AMP nucleosidase|uniref:AMP nucleosidase n=2 Tax=Corynebacterium ammoniagenes TaxID=1697 RepID=A0AAV5G9D9_CORAM|nr:AMP nucleosidase [Corynebacterium ammoniagenes]APT81550.1 AMP nucleosidase [Corynebacterium ammoniagenes DSM 20306]AQS72677.1 AMP nucleosidase [Corynebacterium ammoniagenes]EFG81861.1 AMP nucleosidase [Corynebacterium ammoniagenes DSM 20306]NMF32463.1 AMP nucleosidase [Corynebacterium ammoniagenes]GJN43671.1 AMP nucleosidase [Corynebacterium ammoniagenes]
MSDLQHAHTVDEAIDRLVELYESSCQLARESLKSGDYDAYRHVVYPKIVVDVREWRPIDRSQPFGYVDEAGRYSATLSKPHIIRDYLHEQLTRLTENYPCDIFVGQSSLRIPPEYIRDVGDTSEARRAGDVADAIPRPTLDEVHDAIIDGDWDAFHGEEKPLFHFGPQRFDIACARIEHYTGVEIDTVQKFILFTNYAMHTTEFVRFGLSQLAQEDSRYTAMVLPNGETLHSDDAVNVDYEQLTLTSRFQMPRFDLVTAAGDGITMINIGVGPSNAKTITDCLAVLRPEAWIMIGHCAGLDGRMRIGDLILGNAYQREDNLLDGYVGSHNPIPAIPEVQRMLEVSVDEIYGKNKTLMRTGTVLSTDDRNWEWRTSRQLWEWLRASTAVAVDMESCTIAANGYRYRVPYGTLLSVSDLPLHAVPKLPAQAQAFYSNSKEAHVMCAVRTVEQLADNPQRLHTRKLRRTIGEVPFR